MTTQRRDLGPGDVLIEIRYCGICHTDISHARSEWRPEPYPLIPGHEFTGVVAAVGPGVSRHAVGDRVGVGCMVGSCGECASCRKGQEQYCLNGTTLTYGSVDRDGTLTQGGYSTHVVVDQDFVLPVPEGIGLAEAAPLLCAGITVYSPLRRWGTGPGTKVAVIGLGELGHLAVKFARAMGADVTVLSQSLKKHDDALRLGARSCYATSDPETFGQLASTFDLIVNTVSATVNVDAYLSLLAFDGVLANIGVAPEPLTVKRPRPGRPAPHHHRIPNRRPARDPRYARLLRPASPGSGHRDPPCPGDQRGIPASPGLRRPVPLRHRQLHPDLN